MPSIACTSRFVLGVPIAAGLLLMAGCATGPQSPSDSDRLARHEYGDPRLFPVPPEILDNVEFWRQIYAVWGRGEVVIHDDEHLGIIYEVARLPGPIQASYTEEQRAWLNARLDDYRLRLAALEQRVRAQQPLTEDDKALLQKFERAGGIAALYGAAERVRAQRGIREKFKRGLEISKRYDQHFRQIMRRHGVPEDLAFLPHVESSFQVNARSSVGAGGIWQLMPETGRQYQININAQVDERFDPILAAEAAARYLAEAYRRLGSWPLAITAYNHGKGGMANAKAQHGDNIGQIVKSYKGPAFGFASRNFYAEFIAAREVAAHPERYFPEGLRYEEPWRHDRIRLPESIPIEHLAQHYGIPSDRLIALNLHWREPVTQGNAFLPAGTTVWLPEGTTRRIASLPPPVVGTAAIARADPPALARTQAATGKGKAEDKRPASASTPSPTAIRSKIQGEAQPANTPKTAAAASPRVRYHIVQPEETLYRVAVKNGISVEELRRLNKLGPQDNHIQPGQRLIVGI
ncbi:transglycosylase SLT domain-containing protein [Caldichromatium japonicum]|uniref:Transglycosylase SLT domain-containing protein n=1 Tax=Caldichromatium japonicum TaxID=2699430 RepID=A0A6G7VBG0_9GAMM|nr:lytic transglycosylase domain-containing protein [Caldichromatium japonicum]QIK37399.1 transglycosylase SLT domain-containing protein [Caldichromatium japonicum]